jgi:hypothetical protein
VRPDELHKAAGLSSKRQRARSTTTALARAGSGATLGHELGLIRGLSFGADTDSPSSDTKGIRLDTLRYPSGLWWNVVPPP